MKHGAVHERHDIRPVAPTIEGHLEKPFRGGRLGPLEECQRCISQVRQERGAVAFASTPRSSFRFYEQPLVLPQLSHT
jgi:hypothetical protein